MNKKILSVLLCVLLALAALFVVSCGNDSTDTGTNTDTNDTSTGTNTDTDTDTGTVTPTECTVVFVLGNGETDITMTVDYNDVIRKMPNEPTRAGYEFKGWLYNEKTWVPGKITEDMTIVASWKANNNNLAFIPNGAENTMDPMVIPSDTTIKLENCTLVRFGYEFLGWSTEKDGEVVYLDGADFTMGTDKYNTLYAVWAPATYSITYELDGGTNSENNPTSYDIGTLVTFEAASKKGYTFTGWTLNGEKITSTEGLDRDITLVATYELERYNINYIGIGNAVNNNPSDFNAEDEVVLVAPERKGYEFLGWFSDEECTVPFEKIPIGTDKEVTVYASFKILPFKITYELPEGVTNNKDNISEFTVETEFTFLAPTISQKGYAFDGWFIKGTDTKLEALVPGEQNGAITLEGRVSLINYKITYATDGVEMPQGTVYSYTVNDSSSTIVLPTLEKFGYSFGGWFYSHPEDGVWETPVENNTFVVDPQNPKDITVYAKFTLGTYTITYVLGDEVSGVSVTNNNPTTYDVVNNVEFAPAVTADFSFIGWFINPEKTSKITTTEGYAENLTVYAKWVSGDNLPTKLVTADDIYEIYANAGNSRHDKVWNIFDGKTESGGIWGSDEGAWYGGIGDTLTIVFKEEIEIHEFYIWGVGNWTTSAHTFYDANGNVTFNNPQFIIDGAGWNSAKFTMFKATDEQAPIKVKSIEIEILSLKEGGKGTTHKFVEFEIFMKNPDYIE
ncbi:MAG: InlB B-repeat-containing protein [Clostridia bacterium]|nr:InlB B-repeat-containing protein [Clostridia bacterium]